MIPNYERAAILGPLSHTSMCTHPRPRFALLQSIALERGPLRESLSHTYKHHQRGAATLLAYAGLLCRPGRLYEGSPYSVKRQLCTTACRLRRHVTLKGRPTHTGLLRVRVSTNSTSGSPTLLRAAGFDKLSQRVGGAQAARRPQREKARNLNDSGPLFRTIC